MQVQQEWRQNQQRNTDFLMDGEKYMNHSNVDIKGREMTIPQTQNLERICHKTAVYLNFIVLA